MSIQISTGKLTDTAQEISTLNKTLSDRLDQIRTDMDNLKNIWESEASEVLRGDFESYVPKFTECKEVVDSYVDFLRKTAEAYETTETHLKNNADLFK